MRETCSIFPNTKHFGNLAQILQNPHKISTILCSQLNLLYSATLMTLHLAWFSVFFIQILAMIQISCWNESQPSLNLQPFFLSYNCFIYFRFPNYKIKISFMAGRKSTFQICRFSWKLSSAFRLYSVWKWLVWIDEHILKFDEKASF